MKIFTQIILNMKISQSTVSINYVSGHIDICLRSIKSSLPFSLSLRHSCDKLSQALSRFSVLQVTDSWVGPGNEARMCKFVYSTQLL